MNAHSHTDFEGNATGQARLPKGRYVMEIVESEAFTLHGDTEIQFQAQIVGGKHEGRLVDFGMTVTRHFEVDEEGYELETERGERGDREYAAIRWATGVFDPQDTSELHGKPFAATVGYRGASYRVDGFDRPRAYDTPAPKQAKSTPARGPDGRFLPRGLAEVEADVEQTVEREPWNDVPNWTPTESFMFRLEGDLYELTALAATLETLLTPLTNKMAGYDRPAAASLDYAVTHLADAVEGLEERYRAVRFPGKEAA